MQNSKMSGVELVQHHWQVHSSVHQTLVDTVRPLVEDFVDIVSGKLDGASEAELDGVLTDAGNVYELPYGRITKLPPAVFGTITPDVIELDHDLVVPSDSQVAGEMAQGYENWAHRMAKKYEVLPNRGGMWGYRYEVGAYPKSTLISDQMAVVSDEVYPEADWRMSATAMQAALATEPNFTFDLNFSNRILNAGLDHDQLYGRAKELHGQHSRYVVVPSKRPPTDGRVSSTKDIIQLPIGAYGIDAATRLAQTTVYLCDVIKESGELRAGIEGRLTPEIEAVLAEHTARTRERYEQEPNSADKSMHGLKNSLAEGVLTIAQVISFLSAEKLPGYDDHGALVSEILDGGLIEQFTRSIRPGYIGPLTLSGVYMPGVLESDQGKLSLSKGALDYLGENRKEFYEEMAAKWHAYQESNGSGTKPDMLGMTCPAAKPNGALGIAKLAFKQFY